MIKYKIIKRFIRLPDPQQFDRTHTASMEIFYHKHDGAGFVSYRTCSKYI